ncbi:MAG: SMP-30/gluconolactonase/LRE family protein, partial [Planctomycetaceae bacterium]|nr:SMP-30/gluconolactonase/LRE family protein [Planctomycetaceae bacterium]
MKKVFPLFLILLFALIGCDCSKSDKCKPNVNTEEGESLGFPGTTGGEFFYDAAPGTTGDTDVDAFPGVTELSPQKADLQPQYGQQHPIRQGIDRIRRQFMPEQGTKFPAIQGPPRIFYYLPKDIHNPDGMCVSKDEQTLYMCCPNFNGRENNEGPKKNGGFLVSFNLQGRPRMEKLLEFPPLEETGQFGCMGIAVGPDGNLYVCDNQYFFNPDHKSRIVRVLMDGKKPTGKLEAVVTGIKLANAVMWMEDKMLVTDTFLDLEGKWGSGGIWAFTKDEALKAGSGDNPAIALKPNGTDPHLAVIEEVENYGRGDCAGADGMTCTPDGVVYFGNFGDGAMYRVEFDENLKAKSEKIHKAGEAFSCCDGIFYDKRTDKIYINDSETNAIRAFKPVKAGEKPVFEVIWENGDTDGTGG